MSKKRKRRFAPGWVEGDLSSVGERKFRVGEEGWRECLLAVEVSFQDYSDPMYDTSAWLSAWHRR